MSIPIDCKKCGELVGVRSGLGFRSGFDWDFNPINSSDGSGCNHPEPKRTEAPKLFGLIKQIRVEYPETKTASSWEEYVGPPSKFILWLAIFFGTNSNRITVNKKWVWRRPKGGLFGDGVQELNNLQPKAS